VRAFRIARAAFAALDGEGARLTGGRWNSAGTAVVYAGTSRSIAALETLAHADPDLLPDDLMLFEIDVPDTVSAERIDAETLPEDWRAPGHVRCIELGDEWLRGGASAILHVPSAIIPEERNVLIYPSHAGARLVRVVAAAPFTFDPRLL
jgi:RES domain-containing protein